MSQYKGKREASRQTGNDIRREIGGDAENRKPVGDPFAEEKPSVGEKFEEIAENVSRFFHSRKGKIITGVVCGVLAVAIGATVAVKSWVKPPELPAPNVQTGTDAPTTDTQKPAPDSSTEQEPQGPTDDELYPDDGYAGDMPELSGQRKEGFYTFLLVGTDKDDGNTDTIMVASYDTVNQKVNIMSIPRDTMINESWDIKKINSVYSRTGGNINSLANRVKKLVGFKPDFYVKVELSMFVELIDLVGGVDFYVPQDMQYKDPYQNLHIDLKEGQQVLDGEKAMQLVRFRGYAEGDIKRVEVQQNFLKALIKECLSLKHWGKIKAYIDLALDNVETDLDFGSVVWFASNVLGLNSAPMLDMENVNTCTIPGNYWASTWSRATNSNQSYVTVYANQTVKLVNESFNPYEQKVTTGMLDIMTILENGDIASSTGNLKDTKHNEVMAVRRGEAYYDEEGNLVYGDPSGENPEDPSLPDEGDPNAPGSEPNVPGGEPNVPNGGESGTSGGGSGTTTDPSTGGESNVPAGGETGGETPNDPGTTGETGGDEPTLPDEPSLPEDPTAPSDGEGDGEDSGDDDEMPEWLRPQA